MQRWMFNEKDEIMKCSSTLKERYLLLKRIAKVIIEEDCVIFGGYVRDTILHYHAAKNFYSKKVQHELYTDPTCDPSTFNDRNRVARDIDVYSKETFSNCAKWSKVLSTLNSTPTLPIKQISYREMHNYSWHPLFKKKYRAFRYKFLYYYNMCLSTPTSTKTIPFHIDVVFPVDIRFPPPYQCVPDFNINKLYIDTSGIHTSTNYDYIEDAFDLTETVMDIRHREADFTWTHGMKFPFEESDYSQSDKYRWRSKILERFILMENRGFKIRNSPFIFHEWNKDESTIEFCNGEDACCISHDTFTNGTVMVKFRESKSPMTITSLMKLLANPTPSFEESILKWELVCPVSKTVTQITP